MCTCTLSGGKVKVDRYNTLYMYKCINAMYNAPVVDMYIILNYCM